MSRTTTEQGSMSDLERYVKKRKRVDLNSLKASRLAIPISKLGFCSERHARKPG